MNRTPLFLLLAAVALGCGKPDVTVSGKDGETVKVNKNGTTVTSAPDKKTEPTPENKPHEMKGTDMKGNAFEATAGAVSEKELGLPFFPGSTESPNGSMKSKTGDSTVFLCTRLTKETPQAVTVFYKGKLTDSNTLNVSQSIESSQISGKVGKDTDVVISASRESESGPTRIVMSVTRKGK